MSRNPGAPLLVWSWIGIPALACIAATILLATPLRLWIFTLPEPVLPMVLAFAWATIRPSLMGPIVLMGLGLFNDLLWGGPFGLWAACLLLAYGVTLAGRSLMVGQGMEVSWAWYAIVCLIAIIAAWALMALVSGAPANLVSVFWQFLATAALYPFADHLTDRFADADVRFR